MGAGHGIGIMTGIERTVRTMTKPQRVTYLREHGWYRHNSTGSQTWFAPGWQRNRCPGARAATGSARA
jgi:hypothetical protein